MPEIYWFLPAYGDSRYIGSDLGYRKPSLSYLKLVANTLEQNGIKGVLVPTGEGSGDSIVLSSLLSQHTESLRFLVALRPGAFTPEVAARSIRTLHEASDGRVDLNLVPGDNEAVLADGLNVDHNDREARYQLAESWMDSFISKVNPSNEDQIDIFYAGSSGKAKEIGASFSDIYLTWGEPPSQVKEKIDEVKALAKEKGRELKFGVRLHLVVRETDEAAKHAATELLREITSDDIRTAQSSIDESDSVGRKRMQELHGGDESKVWLQDGLWAGIGLVRGGAGTALVGSADTVERVMREYMDAGINYFILSGYPHLEESFYYKELLAPRFFDLDDSKNDQGERKF